MVMNAPRVTESDYIDVLIGSPKVVSAKVATDGRSVRLKVEGLVEGHVHELHAAGVKSAKGAPLLHDAAYYTLNQLPR